MLPPQAEAPDEDLVSLSACGSFKEDLPPGTLVLIDQFVDRTYKRESSFFGKGLVAHVSMAHPVSPLLRKRLREAALADDRSYLRVACVLRFSVVAYWAGVARWPRRKAPRRGLQ